VLGIDLAQNLVSLARAKAAARGLRNAEFRVGDVLDPTLPESHFDAVVCVFGIFFIPDMQAGGRALWRWCAPAAGSRLPLGGPTSSSPRRQRSGAPFATSGPISTADSTRGIASPTRARARARCEYGLHPPVRYSRRGGECDLRERDEELKSTAHDVISS
jgi:SAM-dependent methyltransferase